MSSNTKKEKQLNNDFTEITYEFRGRPEKKHWTKFLYDGANGTVFSRTPKSWAQLGLFYLLFYIVLGALFTICMQALLSTLTHEHPKWQLDASLIGTNPGLGFRPISNNTEQGSLIWYRPREPASVQVWTTLLDEFLHAYKDRSTLPGGGANQVNCKPGERPRAGQVCRIDMTDFHPCTTTEGYGFNKSSPCVFLKLNRIFNWVPEFYNDPTDLPEDMPEDLKKTIADLPAEQRNQVWISCRAENPADVEVIGPITYVPSRGFPGEFYPYTNTPGYLSPLVAIQLGRPKLHQLINIECRAWAKNIRYRSGRERTGSVHFELLID